MRSGAAESPPTLLLPWSFWLFAAVSNFAPRRPRLTFKAYGVGACSLAVKHVHARPKCVLRRHCWSGVFQPMMGDSNTLPYRFYA